MVQEHLSSQFHGELARIRALLLEMGGVVEQMIVNSVRSLVERDCALAERTIEKDGVVNFLELQIDEKCLQLLARRQPAAKDLRFVTLALKIVTDLERIGDQSAKIASHALELNREVPLKPYIDLPLLAETANNAVRQALDAFVSGNVELAAKVCREDHLVDELDEQIQRELLTFMMEDPGTVPRAMHINAISKNLERIADHATNIAEMVIFMVEGKDVRHSLKPEAVKNDIANLQSWN
jgi:phosphate transport system protein